VSRAILPVRPGRRIAPGLLSKLVLLVLVIGVPVALSALAGGPTLHLDPGALWRAALLRRPGDAQVVAGWLWRAAVLMAWICWAWLTICVVLETRAWLTGRPTVRLPASRSLQWVAAVLVGTAFAVGTAGRAPMDHVIFSGSHAASAHDARPAPGGFGGGPGGRPRVPPGDQLTQLGGQAGGQPGLRTNSDGPPWQLPATLLSLPGDATSNIPDPSLDGSAAIGRHRVSSRETLWSIAESRLGEARRWREIADLNYDVFQADGSRLARDHWIQPGWELVLPSDRRAAPTGSPPTSAEALPAEVASPVHVDAAAPHERVTHQPSGWSLPPSTPVAPVGAGIVGVGVADLVDRLRRVQQRHRGMGARIPLPEPAFRAVEQRIRVGDGRAELDAVEAAVMACGAPVDNEGATSRLQSVGVTGTHIRLTFDSPLGRQIPLPFSQGDDLATVEVARAELDVPATRQHGVPKDFPAPTLVTVGRTGDELLMVNLEGVGSVVLAGDPLANESVGRAMAVELATSRWAAGFDLILVGFGAGMERCERVIVLAGVGPLSADLTWRRLTTGRRLDELDVETADAARCLEGRAGWEPVIVVCGPGVAVGDVEVLLSLSEGGRCGIGVVAICGPAASLLDGAIVLRPRDADPSALTDVLGTLVAPQRLEEEEASQLTAVIDAAAVLDDPSDGAVDELNDELHGVEFVSPMETRRSDGRSRNGVTSYVSPGERTATQIHRATDAGSATAIRRPSERNLAPYCSDRAEGVQMSGRVEVEVAVLGPVEIRGAARGFTRAWATELVIYLAMHPGGASNEAWATALWPERLMAPSSLHSTASVARRSLGAARDGSDHLPRSHGRLGLAPSVGTDWDRFQILAVSDDPECWREALTLVRGRPFDGMRSTDWSILDGTAPSIESAVVDLSGRLAGTRLRSGDARGAEWSARRGLLVSPYDERLYRMLLRAADAAGNPGGVESVMAELVRVVADEIEPIESVHPSTLALYRSLSRRPDRILRAPVRP
jgi:hypothetical protein